MPSGVSTPVYHLRQGKRTFYVRLAETPEASLAPEALAHDLLRQQGVRVPEVVHFEALNPELGRSVMITAEIPGAPLSVSDPGAARHVVLADAGRDLAAFHRIAVDGFGWVRRDVPGLRGELAELRAFALDDLEAHLAAIATGIDAALSRDLRAAIDRWEHLLHNERAVLVHGDLDANHIFHLSGRHTGIIDLGEIRGADPFYDLGHVALHEGEHMPFPLLPDLLPGYRDLATLPPDYMARIHLWSILIGTRALARDIARSTAYREVLSRGLSRALRSISET